MTAPADREFAILRRGEVRDLILANFRSGLRDLVNPETGQLFTEDEIQRATQKFSRWYNESQGTDDYAQGEQRRALFMNDQIRAERACTAWLVNFHGRLWDVSKLSATGGSGQVQTSAVPGTIIVGSTTIGDPTAYQARDATHNKLFQVWETETVDETGIATVTLVGVDTGKDTNLAVDAKLTWTRKDPNMQAQATVVDNDFEGGTDLETDAEFASRILGMMRHREGAGNDAQTRAWTRQSSNAIEDAFIYPCAFHAGSVLIAITQKRTGTGAGPLARIPTPVVLAQGIAYMTPPNSPVYPRPPHVLVTGVQPQSDDVMLLLTMAKGSAAGWADATPFPSYHSTYPYISTVTSQTDIKITCGGDAQLPGGASSLSGTNAPQIMVWNEAKSEFEKLNIESIEDEGSSVYHIILTGAQSFTLATAQVVSPYTPRHAIISGAVEAYFDERGPGQLFDLETDVRGHRCIRFPRIAETRPPRVGAEVVTRVIEALGGSCSDGDVGKIAYSMPVPPTDISVGPKMLVPGLVGVYVL
jgi:hypothetical protein